LKLRGDSSKRKTSEVKGGIWGGGTRQRGKNPSSVEKKKKETDRGKGLEEATTALLRKTPSGIPG